MKRALFVLSQDHGELFNAMYFVLGTQIEAFFALPRRLHVVHGGDLPYPTAPYLDADEILALVDRVEPDVVMLFSGYLLVINRILDLAGQRRLHAGLAERGIPVATTDPSVGVLLAEDDERVSRENPGREWLLDLSPRLGEMLEDSVHLYLTPAVETSRAHHAFYNPGAIPDADELERIRNGIQAWEPIEDDKERWFFILSPEDFEVQLGLLGGRFWDFLEDRILETVAAGRQPILLAPRPCIERLKQTSRSLGSLVAFSVCNFTLFMRLLYEAEHVFYWNAFSASLVARVLAGGAVSLFDEGHLCRTLPPFYAVGLDHFYRGCELPMRRFEEPLDADEITRAGVDQVDTLQAPLLRHFSGGEDPTEIVDRIVERGPLG